MQDYSANSYKNGFITDAIFLIIIASLLQAFIVKGLGFYSDDWVFMSIFHNSKDASLLGLMRSFFAEPLVVVRPVFVLQLAVLYKLFGTNPLGYHIANSLVVISEVIFLYLGLSKLGLSRVIAVSLPLIYILLPHYSTTNIWMACFNANISMAFFFLNFYANLKFANSSKNGVVKWAWLLIALASLVLSVLAYEVVVPLFLLTFLIVWKFSIKSSRYSIFNLKERINVLLILDLLLFASCLLFKILNTDRQGGFNGNYVGQIYSTARAAVLNDFFVYGLKLPRILWKMVVLYTTIPLMISGVGVFLLIFIYVIKIGKQQLLFNYWIKVMAVGIVVYFAGYAIFLATAQIQITSTGISNRVETAAAVGVAICFLGAIGLLCSFIKSEQLRRVAFSVLIAALCSSGYIIKCTIASFFASSYALQLQTLDSLFASFRVFNSKDTLILDGLCPYEGPAPVFECYWDIKGAMQTHYGDTAIKADVRTKRLKYDRKGVITEVYGEKKVYPFSENLVVYNLKNRKQYRLNTFEVADKYFSQNPINTDECPQGEPGYGVAIF
jgi:hypothetical protein